MIKVFPRLRKKKVNFQKPPKSSEISRIFSGNCDLFFYERNKAKNLYTDTWLFLFSKCNGTHVTSSIISSRWSSKWKQAKLQNRCKNDLDFYWFRAIVRQFDEKRACFAT